MSSRQHPHVRMLHEDIGERLDLGLRVGGARRVAGRVEQEPLGLGRDGLGQDFRLQLVAVLDAAVGGHGLAAAEQHDVGVGHPVGRRDHDLVAGVQRAQQRVVEHLLAAGADRDLRRLVVEAVLALELGADGGLELGDAVDVGVLRLALLEGADGGVLDVVGRVEIGLARRQRDHVPAFRFQLARFRRHPDGLGGGNAVDAVGEKSGWERAHVCLYGFELCPALLRSARTLRRMADESSAECVARAAMIDGRQRRSVREARCGRSRR